MSDPYLDPKSGVLRNKLGLTDAADLERAEALLTTLRDTEVASTTVPGIYDLEHLCRFHRRIFGDVYAWAGKVRTVDISKPGAMFCVARYIDSYASETVFPLVVELDYLRGRDHAGTVTSLAAVLAEVNALHPFREGNGRTQRAFLRQMAAAAGWHIDWAAADPEVNIAASKAAMDGANGELERMLAPLVTAIDPQPGAAKRTRPV